MRASLLNRASSIDSPGIGLRHRTAKPMHATHNARAIHAHLLLINLLIVPDFTSKTSGTISKFMSRRWAWIALALCVACIGFAVLWRRPIPGESILLALLSKDARIQKGMWTIDVVQVRHAVRLQLALWPAAFAFVACWWLLPDRIRMFLRERSFRLFIALACSSVIYLTLWRRGFEGPWSPIALLMT